jgi:enoyl-CoA hydratase/carnithine racemase
VSDAIFEYRRDLRSGTMTISRRTEGSARWLILDKPARRNAFDRAMLIELTDQLRTAEADESIDVVVLTGADGTFTSGGDLHYVNVLRQAGDRAAISEFTARNVELFSLIEQLRKPVIAAVSGVAYAGGLVLALACDLIVAGDDAQFCAIQARRGFIDPFTATRLSARIGMEHAKRMVYTSAVVGAEEAYRIGLVSAVVPAAGLDDEARRLASAIASVDGESVAIFKSMFGRQLPPFDIWTYAGHMVSEAARAGTAEFVDGARRAAGAKSDPHG